MNSERSSISLNVAIVPDTVVFRKALELSNRILEAFNVAITLHEEKSVPHITLYQAQYPSRNTCPILLLVGFLKNKNQKKF